jgi:hypothetical protein
MFNEHISIGYERKGLDQNVMNDNSNFLNVKKIKITLNIKNIKSMVH